MNSKFKITIPKPCHENWNEMTPKEKGRFCKSCSKTVVDFTKKSTVEIQDYLVKNKSKRVCGHFYRKQLDSVTIEIPRIAFNQQLSFQKLFTLSLFFVMGTSLFSCQYSDGKKQKIENIIIIDTLKIEKVSILKTRKVSPPPKTTGIFICDTTSKKDSIIEIITTGELVEVIVNGDLAVEGEITLEEETDISFIAIEESPRFKTSKKLSKHKIKEDFDKRMKNFFQENFDINTTINLGLYKGKHKIQTQFIIDENGNLTDIKVRAPHPALKREVIRMLNELPQFIPGKQNGIIVKTKYTLPISFEVK
ncbi:energy transducer TonB [Polaribacter sp. SA4-12]|uniref:energy transducer TonB n=1 Tax=Polaribacter sp. SA4-12 TaxID=1312072 RepID=UPI000B3D067E|nr:energy transducer TonB [Polaribacter sp. SA4-12]ARV15503.1 hypothetical protein BTO07_10275 [Polaribacter sp. SA4-12]